MFRKDLVIEHAINSILLFLLDSLVSLLLSSFLPPFASSAFGLALSLFRSRIARSSPPFEPPVLPCRSGNPRHRCNVSCRVRAHLRETCFETRDTPTRSTQPRYVGDSFSLSLSPAFRNIGGGGGSGSSEGQRDEEGRETTSSSSLASLFGLSHESFPCCDMCARARARVTSASPPSSLLLGSHPLSLALSMSVSRSAGRRTGRGAPSLPRLPSPPPPPPPPLLHRTQRRCSSCIRYCSLVVAYTYICITLNEREKTKSNRKEREQKRGKRERVYAPAPDTPTRHP